MIVSAKRAAAIASLKALGAGEHCPARLIIQTSQNTEKSKRQLTNVRQASQAFSSDESSKLEVVEVYDEEILDRFLAQCALQPHLSGILSDVFQQNEGKEFYITEGTNFAGKPFSFARRHFTKAVVCGIRSKSTSSVCLNPPDDAVLQEGDELVVLCSDLWNTKPTNEPLPAPSDWTQQVERHPMKYISEHVVVLCFGNEGYVDSGFVDALSRFAPRPVNVTVVAK